MQSVKGTAIVTYGVAKVAFGLVRGGFAISTAVGHGIIGGFLRSNHMMGVASRWGKQGLEHAGEIIKDGGDTVKDGIDQWRSG